ncbi:MAG: DUF1501 domain-containing protein [Lysobacteraceae bacterium]
MQGNRRDFLKGCCAAAMAAGSGSTMAFFDPLALAGGKSAASGDVLVYVFLRGAIDGLHLLTPYAGPDRIPYVNTRGSLAIPVERLRRVSASGTGSNWGWHPRAGGGTGDGIGTTPKWLQKLYNANRLAVVHATGMPTPNRSHFEAQAMMELGTPGITGGGSGWLARYLSAISGTPGLPAPLIAPAFGFGSNMQTSLIGLDQAVGFNSAEQFRVDGFQWNWNQRGADTQIYPLWSGNSSLERAGRDAADALEVMREHDFTANGYTPGGGAVYPSGSFGTQLRNLAQMLKSPIKTGLIAAAIDHGFWDTHEGQGMPNPGVAGHYDWFGNLVEELGHGLDAFYTDLNAHSIGGGLNLMHKVTVIVQSEFGRRFLPNASAGTDHGYGNIMMALGNRVSGGQLHGTFPGLDDNSLYESQDVAVTTDFRQIISEALVDRMGLPPAQIPQVFPGFSYNTSGTPDVFQTG